MRRSRCQGSTVALVWAVGVLVVLVGTASAVGTTDTAPSSGAVSTAAAPPVTQQASAGDRCAQCEAFLRHAYVLPTLLD